MIVGVNCIDDDDDDDEQEEEEEEKEKEKELASVDMMTSKWRETISRNWSFSMAMQFFFYFCRLSRRFHMLIQR